MTKLENKEKLVHSTKGQKAEYEFVYGIKAYISQFSLLRIIL